MYKTKGLNEFKFEDVCEVLVHYDMRLFGRKLS